MKRCLMVVVVLAAGAALQPAAARVTRIEIVKTEPAFGGKVFPGAGAFERLSGIAHGEVDPKAPANAGIQDIGLAPRNARGMVEYAAEIDILRPANPDKANGILLFNAVNRGNKDALARLNADVPGPAANTNALTSPGDGWVQSAGTTLIFFAWQADVLPGDSRMTLKVPVARNPDGSPVTGLVRSEFVVQAPAKAQNLSSGWFTTMTHDSYPSVSTDNRKPLADGFLPTLTERAREGAPRVPIPSSQWSFADCSGAEARPDPRRICYPDGFKPGHIYELLYRAQDPLVLGLGFAAARDIATFFKTRDADDAGTKNPVAHGGETKAIVMGSSQGGRYIRTLLMLGFNRQEGAKAGPAGRVFDGAYVHIGGGLIPLNQRFGAPGRAWGAVVDHLYPAYDFPFSYAKQTDPLTGRSQGILDRCTAEDDCPRIFHAATALEVWEGRQSLGLTDPLGRVDVADPADVRSYIMASTQHGPAALPLPQAAPFGTCAQQPNPNPQLWTMRALMAGLIAWVRDDKRPPNGAAPRIADGTLVPPDQVRFPAIPANAYGGVTRPAMLYLGTMNPLHVMERGPGWRPAASSGVASIEPPRQGSTSYGQLVPQVDADGNDAAGVRSLALQVPIGTYTAWNQFRADWFPDQFCNFTGTFVPFAATKEEREKAGDPRPSLAERYPTKSAYVNAVREAADRLIAARFLLPDDAYRLITEAETNGVRTAP